ncbi:hypothetical protein TcWFU_006139 [Taenia crassiceps]|uniref:Uncharacterized protein n=1 Tax=Taenia crassiceps TaxID=6207 RepID=A0ABR4Q0U3_9CEST
MLRIQSAHSSASKVLEEADGVWASSTDPRGRQIQSVDYGLCRSSLLPQMETSLFPAVLVLLFTKDDKLMMSSKLPTIHANYVMCTDHL